MGKKRNRTRPLLSFQERLNNFAQEARAEAKKLPPSAERSDLLQKARDSEAAAIHPAVPPPTMTILRIGLSLPVVTSR